MIVLSKLSIGSQVKSKIMKPKPTYIQLEANEELASIRDRLSFLRGKRVLLIWPEEGTTLRRKLDLVFVQREARQRLIQLALATHDPVVVEHAADLGISTFATIDEAENSKWKRGRTKVFIQRHHKPEDEPEPQDLMPVASRVRHQRKRLHPVLYRLLQLSILVIVLAVISGTLYITMPRADVRLRLNQVLLEVDTIVIADPNALDIDVENGIIPATRVSVTVQTVQQVSTSGVQTSASARALGSVTLTNLSNVAILIPIGTRVATSTSGQVTFETTAEASVPANDSLGNVPIIAIEDYAGNIGNVAAGAINTLVSPIVDDLSVINTVPTSGGVNQTYNIVTPEDMELALDNARQYLQATAYSEMQATLSETQIIVIETINLPDEELRNDWVTFSHTMGDITDTLTLNMRAIVEALVIDDRFAQQVVFARLSLQRPPDMLLNPESFLYRRGPVIETDANGRTSLQVFGEGIASAQVNTYQLQADLTGRSLEDAQRVIAATVDITPGSQSQIEIFPEFFGQMPFLPIRINIIAESGS
jgi:Baseplate J-like protein